MHFSKLRLTGFKSFVDPTELLIEPGLTGIVGPNGCGKSNLLEAIRWVMGENRAKSLRGDGMDDVIFAGTVRRPPRHMAEVSLMLDNLEQDAPDPYRFEDMIEITRRIERSSGSVYRINGIDVRQKDVRLLFADAATGAHSPALVSQGHIGTLINAKPEQRRKVLEEAAGVSGLQSRRREAELRLKAAEDNLTRLQDVVEAVDGQMNSLRRQARQALRYREISQAIDKADAALLFARWVAAAESVFDHEEKLRRATQQVAGWTVKVTEASAHYEMLEKKTPDCRKQEIAAAAKLQNLRLDLSRFQEDLRRRKELTEALGSRLEQIQDDTAREECVQEEASAALVGLDVEEAELIRLVREGGAEEKQLMGLHESAQEEFGKAEEAYDKLAGRLAEERARRKSAENDADRFEQSLQEQASDFQRIQREKEDLAEKAGSDRERAELRAMLDASEAGHAHLLEELEKVRGKNEDLQSDKLRTEGEVSKRVSNEKALSGEVGALKSLLALEQGDTPVSELVRVEAGYEKAFAAAFGASAEAALEAEKDRHWTLLPQIEVAVRRDFPEGMTRLSDHILSAPNALARRLAFVGVVADGYQGAEMALHLAPGERLVDRSGTLWRWDGFVCRHAGDSESALRLERMNRLKRVEDEFKGVQAETIEAKAELENLKARLLAGRAAEDDLNRGKKVGEQKLAEFAKQIRVWEEESERRQSRLQMLEGLLERHTQEQQALTRRLEEARSIIVQLRNLNEQEAHLEILSENRQAARQRLTQATAAREGFTRERRAREKQLVKLGETRDMWSRRQNGAVAQLASLAERRTVTEKELAVTALTPSEDEDRENRMQAAILEQEKEHGYAADHLAAHEAEIRQAQKDLKEKEATYQHAREVEIRAESATEGAANQRRETARQIGDRFGCDPSKLLHQFELGKAEDLPATAVLQTRLEKLKAERDRLGAVNLRAEEEADGIAAELERLKTEKAEIEEAVARLRGAISTLNREGRERLKKAFDVVNGYFSELFTSLFDGGEAHLEMVESDDPMEAGIEIFASPPGKKLQALSLLSGGEQALTATSLIFAVFMTNPAPICVLDEVDAPLDDANVERFCHLLDEMVARTRTRFLIVTHNAVSMSRMNRLFGVTMTERGVSTLVSVDLERAAGMRAAE